jgi:hypothetical protein
VHVERVFMLRGCACREGVQVERVFMGVHVERVFMLRGCSC